MPPLPIHSIAPPVVDGYPLNPERGFFSVVVPEAGTNLVTNPSAETGVTGYTSVGSATGTRTTAQQRRGVYSIAVTPTAATGDGIYYGSISLTSGTTYTFSLDFLGIPGVKYQIYFATTGAATLGTAFVFTATGRWQRPSVTYTETSSTTRRIYVTKSNNTSTGVFYVDGLQVEAKEYATTYIDGDQQGFVINQIPPAYQWNGTAHASTSVRSAQTRAGGKEVRLDLLGFLVLAYTGLGMASINLIADAYAQGDGSQYQATYAEARGFSIAGLLTGYNLQHLQRQRSGLIGVLHPDLTTPRQPLVLRYQSLQCEDEYSAPLEIVCHYAGGLEGEINNLYQERLALRFMQFVPYIQASGEEGTSLSYQQTVANANYIVQRSATGVWSALSTGMVGTGSEPGVHVLKTMPNGTLYAGGRFSDAGGSGADHLAKWDGSTWSALGSVTALSNTILALATNPANTILYVGGAFLNAGGVADADCIATWDGSSWGALSTGANSTVIALAVAADSTLYAGGIFTAIGASSADKIAKWNGSAWSALGSDTALNDNVYALAMGRDGTTLYAGGYFTNAGGVANADYIAKWDGAAWSALGTPPNQQVFALAVGLDGTLYAGGNFSTIGGVSAVGIAQWNGTAWQPLGSSVNSTVENIFVGPDGMIYVSGWFTQAGDITGLTGFARWNGSAWLPSEMTIDGWSGADDQVREVEALPSGVITVGYTLDSAAASTVTAATVTTVTNNGSAPVTPIITFTGPGRVYSVQNTASGSGIYFSLTLNSGEKATLDLTPGAISFVSTSRGNILNTISVASDLAGFRLLPGSNTISVFIAGTTDSNTAVTMRWRPQYWAVDDAVD